MLYTSEPEALRAFLRDKLGFTGSDVGGHFRVPGGFTLQLHQPHYRRGS